MRFRVSRLNHSAKLPTLKQRVGNRRIAPIVKVQSPALTQPYGVQLLLFFQLNIFDICHQLIVALFTLFIMTNLRPFGQQMVVAGPAPMWQYCVGPQLLVNIRPALHCTGGLGRGPNAQGFGSSEK